MKSAGAAALSVVSEHPAPLLKKWRNNQAPPCWIQCKSRNVGGRVLMNFSGIISLNGVSDPDDTTIGVISDLEDTCYKMLTTVGQSGPFFSFSWKNPLQYTIALLKENGQCCKTTPNTDFSFKYCMTSPTHVISKSLCSQRSWEPEVLRFCQKLEKMAGKREW